MVGGSNGVRFRQQDLALKQELKREIMEELKDQLRDWAWELIRHLKPKSPLCTPAQRPSNTPQVQLPYVEVSRGGVALIGLLDRESQVSLMLID